MYIGRVLCPNLENGKWKLEAGYLIDGVEGVDSEWTKILVGDNSQTVYVTKSDIYYKKTKDVWQKCIKSDSTTTPVKKTIKKPKGNGITVENPNFIKNMEKELE